MLIQLHRVPIDRFAFLPDPAALFSNSLSRRKLADDPLEPGLRQAVLAAWLTVSAAQAGTTHFACIRSAAENQWMRPI
jgi:hypothetical protein